MNDDLDHLTANGSVSHDVYRIIREAIQQTGEQRGRLFEVGHEAHYQALAVAMALKANGYRIGHREASS